jgi:hypothetical protein
MHTLFQYKKLLALILFFLFLVVLSVSIYIQEERKEYILKTELMISKQETKLAAIAELTDRDGADAVVEAIIQDCSLENRDRFDTLLSRLSSLKGTELKEIEQLFNACGNFYAERKAVMVARFEREFEVFLDFIDILTLVDKKADDLTYNVEGWGKLVEMEKERSTLSTRLVVIQGEIIQALLKGASIASDEMQSLLVEGQQTKEALEKLSVEIDTQRQEVLAL